MEARTSRSHCMEPFSSLPSDSGLAPPSAMVGSSALLTCLLSRAKPEMHRRRESVLRPRVRPRYTVLQGATELMSGQKEKNKKKKTRSESSSSLVGMGQPFTVGFVQKKRKTSLDYLKEKKT